MALNGVVNTGTGPVYVNQNGLQNANIHSVFVPQTVQGGRGSATLGALTGAGTGTLAIAGTASKTLADVTGAGTGTLLGSGTGSATLGDVTGTGTGVLPIVGTGSKTLGDVTGTGTATLTLSGSGSATLDAVTGSATGVLPIAGAGAATLEDLAGAGAGTLAIAAAGAVTLDDLTGAGTAVDVITGQGAATLENLTGSAAATLTGEGTAGDTLAQLVERAKGSGGVSPRRRRRKHDPIAIAARLWIRPPRLRAVVELGDPPIDPEGDFRGLVDFCPLVRGVGTVGTIGRALLALPPSSIEARVFVVPCGDARLVLYPVARCHARGRHDHFTDKQIERAISLLLVA